MLKKCSSLQNIQFQFGVSARRLTSRCCPSSCLGRSLLGVNDVRHVIYCPHDAHNSVQPQSVPIQANAIELVLRGRVLWDVLEFPMDVRIVYKEVRKQVMKTKIRVRMHHLTLPRTVSITCCLVLLGYGHIQQAI